MSRWPLLLGSVGVFALGCNETPAQLVVTVDSDLESADLGCLAVSAGRPGSDEPAFHEFVVVPDDPGVGQVTFPFSFGVSPPGGDPANSVRVTLRGYPGSCPSEAEADPRVVRVAQTGFRDCTRLHLPIFLSQACAGDPLGCAAMTPEQTCVPQCVGGVCQAECAPVEIPVEVLRPVEPGDELDDAGVAGDASEVLDGSADTGVGADGGPDSGVVCPGLCTNPQYVRDRVFTDGSNSVVSAVVAAPGNDFVIAGSFADTIDFGDGMRSGQRTDAFVASYAFDGSLNWGVTFGGSLDDVGSDVAVDSAGNVYVTGAFKGAVDFGGGSRVTGPDGDAYVVSLDSNGVYRWDVTFGGAGVDLGSAIAVNARAQVVVAGDFQTEITLGGTTTPSRGFFDVFVASFDASGADRWHAIIAGGNVESAHGVAVDSSGNAFVAGGFRGDVEFGLATSTPSQGGTDAYLASFRDTGTLNWVETIGGAMNDIGLAVAADPSGNAFIAGSFQGTVDFGEGPREAGPGGDGYVVSVDTDAAFRWMQLLGGDGDTRPGDLTTDAVGNVYVSGRFTTQSDFGGGIRMSQGGLDAFVVSYGTDSAYRFDRTFGANGIERADGLAVGRQFEIYLGGSFQNMVSFGGPTRTVPTSGGYLVTLACPCP